jgi:response regulator RpfG family c-di-GMP phosphodiesterase
MLPSYDPYKSKVHSYQQERSNNRNEIEHLLGGNRNEETIPETKASRKTVMVCDDERDILLMFELELQSKYNVLAVDSGKGCIQKFIHEKQEGKKIDLILLDYKLGDMPGDDVARKIKQLNSVKIILITAYDLDEQTIQDLKLNGCIVDIVRKPVDLEWLSSKIAQEISV